MEQFVKLLYDRLESNKELQMQLFVIMQNAINEMHNNGILFRLTGEMAQLVHDPDPEVRVTQKTSLAKAVGKQFIPATSPVPSQEGLSYLATVNYEPRFINSIILCIQGGIEGLHQAFAKNSKLKLEQYRIQLVSGSEDISAFLTNMEQLDKMYDDVSIVVLSDGKVVYGGKGSSPAPKSEKKKGFFSNLFHKK